MYMYIYISYICLSFIKGDLNCFCLMVIMNDTFMNIGMQILDTPSSVPRLHILKQNTTQLETESGLHGNLCPILEELH